MTRMAIRTNRPNPANEDWNAWAFPWNVDVMVGGSAVRANSLISSTASPME